MPDPQLMKAQHHLLNFWHSLIRLRNTEEVGEALRNFVNEAINNVDSVTLYAVEETPGNPMMLRICGGPRANERVSPHATMLGEALNSRTAVKMPPTPTDTQGSLILPLYPEGLQGEQRSNELIKLAHESRTDALRKSRERRPSRIEIGRSLGDSVSGAAIVAASATLEGTWKGRSSSSIRASGSGDVEEQATKAIGLLVISREGQELLNNTIPRLARRLSRVSRNSSTDSLEGSIAETNAGLDRRRSSQGSLGSLVPDGWTADMLRRSGESETERRTGDSLLQGSEVADSRFNSRSMSRQRRSSADMTLDQDELRNSAAQAAMEILRGASPALEGSPQSTFNSPEDGTRQNKKSSARHAARSGKEHLDEVFSSSEQLLMQTIAMYVGCALGRYAPASKLHHRHCFQQNHPIYPPSTLSPSLPFPLSLSSKPTQSSRLSRVTTCTCLRLTFQGPRM